MTSTPDPFTYPQDSYPGSSPSGVQPYDPVAQGGYQGGFQQQAYQDPAVQAGYAQPGYPVGAYTAPGYPAGAGAYVADQKSKVAAGLLGIFLGQFGVHNFYLGNTGKAVGQLVGTIVGYVLLIVIIGIFIIAGISIWGLIEGILILSAQPGAQPWGVDARGVPLSS